MFGRAGSVLCGCGLLRVFPDIPSAVLKSWGSVRSQGRLQAQALRGGPAVLSRLRRTRVFPTVARWSSSRLHFISLLNRFCLTPCLLMSA